jgi:exodeoxyribonuclease III
MISIVSYNLNGIRAAIKNGLLDWLEQTKPDIFCVQETKATPDQVGVLLFEALGYQHFWFSAQKKGYSGVAVFTKITPRNVVYGCGIPAYDAEGRVIRLDFEDWSLLNCYFPSGTSGDERQGVKMDFLRDFSAYIAELKQEKSRLIVVGDYNIAHNEIDLHNPKANKTTTGFLPEEREWMNNWFASGFVDAFRYKNPELIAYSWWSYRFNSRANNRGWRIDYQSVTDNLKNNIIAVRQVTEAIHADHCAVWMEIELN